jgi:nucleoside-diphosphate-sugar epimerase
MDHPLAGELDAVLEATRPLWSEVRGERLLMTGGSGFFGRWLLESLLWADQRLDLRLCAVVLSRDPSRLLARMPHLTQAVRIHVVEGDVRTLPRLPGAFSHVIHAATDTGASSGPIEPRVVFDTIVEGTRQTLEAADRAGTSRFLFASSGAVYGKQPSAVTHVPEEYTGAPDPLASSSAYAEGKRAAETLCATAAGARLQVLVARPFAFVGPWLPLDRHFAAGNFIRDALAGGPIRIQGDGTPVRSYLYAADLAVWLWTILFRGRSLRPYNVGSETAVTIGELADRIAASVEPPVSVQRAHQPVEGTLPERYVPSVARARDELGLSSTVGLDEAIRRTLAWHRQTRRTGVHA